jgi:hypothetical protein
MKTAGFLLALSVALGTTPQERSLKPPELSASIDRILEARWKRDVKGDPAPVADDAEFLRRLSLDLRGRPAGVAEVRAFMADPSDSKRLAKIDEYLASSEYNRIMARRLASVLFNDYDNPYIVPGKNFSYQTVQRLVKDFLAALEERVAKDEPVPNLLGELLEAQGRTDEKPLVLYKLSMWNGDLPAFEFADRVSKSWLGIRVSCARCHDHPFDRWTQEDFYGLSGFFTRHKVKCLDKGGGMAMGTDCDEVELTEDAKAPELTNPDSGGLLKPTFLLGGSPGSDQPRMRFLTVFIQNKNHNQLARNFANRVWDWFMGRGLVMPVDDFNQKNKASIHELLEKITGDFSSNKYSLKHLARAICASKSYQRASARGEPGDVKDYARATLKPLTTAQLFLSIAVATRGGDPVPDRTQAPFNGWWGWYAGQMSLVFGPSVGWTEVTPLPGNARQMLMIRNGEIIQQMIRNPGGTASRAAKLEGSPADKVEFVFLSVYGRKPQGQETARWAAWLEEKRGEPGLTDLVWTLINSTEFLTRH